VGCASLDVLATLTDTYGSRPPLSGYSAHGPQLEAGPSGFDTQQFGAPVRETTTACYSAPIGPVGLAQFASPVAPASSSVAPIHFSQNLPVKLTPDNYLFWHDQVLPLLHSHSLECFIDGTCPCPPLAHPSYRLWIAQDQAILSALQGSLLEGVAGLVLFAATTWDVWVTLENNFSSQSSE
jgi:hypothetical protein